MVLRYPEKMGKHLRWGEWQVRGKDTGLCNMSAVGDSKGSIRRQGNKDPVRVHCGDSQDPRISQSEKQSEKNVLAVFEQKSEKNALAMFEQKSYIIE